jgi:hypothetical protein
LQELAYYAIYEGKGFSYPGQQASTSSPGYRDTRKKSYDNANCDVLTTSLLLQGRKYGGKNDAKHRKYVVVDCCLFVS